MAIVIEITIEAMEAAGDRPEPLESGRSIFRRMPGASREGPCDQCAPYFGVEHDGSGESVPMAPLHLNCVCWDLPVGFDEFVAEESPEEVRRERFEWLKALGATELFAILGKTRAALVQQGKVSIEDLYDDEGLLVPLAELPTPDKRKGQPRKRR